MDNLCEFFIEDVKCPRCNGGLFADVFEVDTETGLPARHGFLVFHQNIKRQDDCIFSYDEGIEINQKVFDSLIKSLNVETRASGSSSEEAEKK